MIAVAVTLYAVLLSAADLSRIMAEPNLEKRSRLALAEAETALKSARSAYEAGKAEEWKSGLDDAASLSELAHKSLVDTGKHARNNPKHFKHAEISTRALIRQLDAFEQAMAADDRPAAAPVRKRIAAVNEGLLNNLMEKKRR